MVAQRPDFFRLPWGALAALRLLELLELLG
jgi:hypothetical protein